MSNVKIIIPDKGKITIKELTFGEIYTVVEYILQIGHENWHEILIDEKLANMIFIIHDNLTIKDLIWSDMEPIYEIFMKLNFQPIKQFIHNQTKI